MNFVHLITDYGVGDPAFGEVIQKLKHLSPDIEIHPTSVPAFSTLATGFWIGQYALVNSWPGLTIFSNTAPRDLPGQRTRNEGEPFVYAQLKNGVHICTVNAGYSLSFIKPYITKFHKLNVQENGSQFRSRDFYPEAVVKIVRSVSRRRMIYHARTCRNMMNHVPTKIRRDSSSFSVPPVDTRRAANLQNLLGPALSPSQIPDVPPNRLAFIDGYGNLKTTIRASEFAALQPPELKNSQLRGLKVSFPRHSEATTKSLSSPVAEESHRRSMINHGPTVGAHRGACLHRRNEAPPRSQPPRLRIQKPRGLTGPGGTHHNACLQLSPGQQLHIILNGITKTATYTNGIFEVPTGQLAFAPGSSGGDDPFMEIIYRTNIENGSSAAQKFNHPHVEAEITLQI